MTAIPSENMDHIRRIVRETLPDDARPDYQPRNRWYVVSLQSDGTAQDGANALEKRLRESGYKVSVVRNNVKVTRADLHWPDAQ